MSFECRNIENQCSNDRILLAKKIEQSNGTVEYVQSAFMEAERKTPVEVALVKVQFPKKERRSSIIDRLQREKTVKETADPNTDQLVENDFIKAIVDQYKLEVQAGCRLIREYQGMQPVICLSSKKRRRKNGSNRGVHSFIKSLHAA